MSLEKHFRMIMYVCMSEKTRCTEKMIEIETQTIYLLLLLNQNIKFCPEEFCGLVSESYARNESVETFAFKPH